MDEPKDKQRSLKVVVLPGHLAEEYEPDEPTAAIRIFDSFCPQPDPLRDSPLYVDIFTHIFDDLCGVPKKEQQRLVREAGFKTITKAVAKTLLKQVDNVLPECNTLLVHCTAGQSRSPAVAIALMETFPDIEYAVIVQGELHWMWVDAECDEDLRRFLELHLKPWKKEGYMKTPLAGMKDLFKFNRDVHEKILSVALNRERKGRGPKKGGNPGIS
jgi:hypothetical protein